MSNTILKKDLYVEEEYVPSNNQNDNFYERLMEQRSRDLNNPSTTE